MTLGNKIKRGLRRASKPIEKNIDERRHIREIESKMKKTEARKRRERKDEKLKSQTKKFMKEYDLTESEAEIIAKKEQRKKDNKEKMTEISKKAQKVGEKAQKFAKTTEKFSSDLSKGLSTGISEKSKKDKKEISTKRQKSVSDLLKPIGTKKRLKSNKLSKKRDRRKRDRREYM